LAAIALARPAGLAGAGLENVDSDKREAKAVLCAVAMGRVPFEQGATPLRTDEGVSALQIMRPPNPRSKPVYWMGRQWAVTSYGVEARDGTYPIEARRIWEDNEGWGWVHQMEEKNWVDLPDFVEALRLARQRWPKRRGSLA
jgi:hypothetical protein